MDGAGQGETLLAGTVTFTGLTSAALSGMSIIDPIYVATGVAFNDDGVTFYCGSGVGSRVASIIAVKPLKHESCSFVNQRTRETYSLF